MKQVVEADKKSNLQEQPIEKKRRDNEEVIMRLCNDDFRIE